MRVERRMFRDSEDAKALPAHQPGTFGDAAREMSCDPIDLTGQFELELPAGFAALGEQLANDADHLARCYPAGMVVKSVAPPMNNRRLIRWGGAAAAIV